MTSLKKLVANLERDRQRVAKDMAKFVAAHERMVAAAARERARHKRYEATRHYRLGLMAESFLFDEPELLAQVKARIELELRRVREVFALHEPLSWFEQPQRDEPVKTVHTRRFRLGMVLETLLRGNDALCARFEALAREQAPHIQHAFGLDEPGSSWFDERRAGAAGGGSL